MKVFSILLALLSLASLAEGIQQSLAQAPSAQREVSKEEWMSDALRTRTSAGALYLARFKDPMYIVMSPINWTPSPGQNHAPVDVPVGFVTDLASIPPVFFSI